jgi:hypothetical protein
MTQRLNAFTASLAAMQPWIALGKTIQTNYLEPLLRELVMKRASPQSFGGKAEIAQPPLTCLDLLVRALINRPFL